MTKRAQILAIIAAVLLVFFPVIFGEISVVDDRDMLAACLNHPWNLKSIFFPGNGGGLYYRPLTIASYLLDLKLIGPDPAWMHLVNVLLHLANTLLVFRIASQLAPQFATDPTEKKERLLPLALALLWGFHPLVTESVDWISGRTDILAAFFVLLSASFILRFRENRASLSLALALLAFFGGVLSKEVALTFLPGALLLLLAPHGTMEESVSVRKKRIALFIGLGCLVLLLFFLMRSFAFSSNSGKIGLSLKILQNNPQFGIFTVFRALGFYMKKLFYPWPLNFAIDGVDPLYELLAFPLLGFCLVLLWNRSLLSALFLAGVFLIAPAFTIAMGQIAWMPYAERYLYLPSIFVTLAAGLFAAKHIAPKMPATIGKIALGGIITLFAVTTFQRNLLWQTNLALLEDTAIQSDGNRTILALHSSALLSSDQPEKALAVAQRAAATPMLGYNPDADNLMGESLFRLGRTEEALVAYARAYQRSKKDSQSALEGMIEIHTAYIYQHPQDISTAGHLLALEEAGLALFKKNKDPMTLYQLGKAFHAAGKTKKAREYWKQALSHMPPDHEYRPFAAKLVRNQQGGT